MVHVDHLTSRVVADGGDDDGGDGEDGVMTMMEAEVPRVGLWIDTAHGAWARAFKGQGKGKGKGKQEAGPLCTVQHSRGHT